MVARFLSRRCASDATPPRWISTPVAHLIELGCLDYPQRYRAHDKAGRNTLVADVERWAAWVAERTRRSVDHLYPRVGDREMPAPYYFWVRTMPSPDPNQTAEIPILSSRLLAAARRSAWVTITATPDGVNIEVHQGTLPVDPTLKEGFEAAGSVTCPISGITAPQRDVKQHGRDSGFGYRLYAVCDIIGRDRTYRAPTPAEIKGPLLARAEVAALDGTEFDDGTSRLPDETVDEDRLQESPVPAVRVQARGARCSPTANSCCTQRSPPRSATHTKPCWPKE